jgi:hypothetical protein
MDRYSIILNKKPQHSEPQYIEIPKEPRQELFPDDEYKAAVVGAPRTWTKWGDTGRFTNEFKTFIYRRRIK